MEILSQLLSSFSGRGQAKHLTRAINTAVAVHDSAQQHHAKALVIRLDVVPRACIIHVYLLRCNVMLGFMERVLFGNRDHSGLTMIDEFETATYRIHAAFLHTCLMCPGKKRLNHVNPGIAFPDKRSALF